MSAGVARYAGVMKGTDAEIDHLYQRPLDQFTAERNALAKRAGPDAARIRALPKPSVAAWAVNQLYWTDRRSWDSLVAAADNLRRAHKAVLSGRTSDIRAAGKVHDDAVEAALDATLDILRGSSHPVTDATRQGVINTLRALPAPGVRPGRLVTALQPGGFEMLAGLTIARGAVPAAHQVKPAPAPKPRHGSSTKSDARALTASRQEVASSERALKEADQAVRRDEFESARAARDERRAAEAVEKAREALDAAKHELERAEAAHRTAREERDAAEQRVPAARETLAAAKSRAHAAAAALKKLIARE